MKANENNQKVTAVIEDFLWHCEFEKKLSEKTLNAYKADLSQFAFVALVILIFQK